MTRVIAAVPTAALAFLLAADVSAQGGAAQGAWLGVPLPGGLSLPPQLSVLDSREFAASKVPDLPGEERLPRARGSADQGVAAAHRRLLG